MKTLEEIIEIIADEIEDVKCGYNGECVPYRISMAIIEKRLPELRAHILANDPEVVKMREELSRYKCRKFPIMSQDVKYAPSSVPWDWVAPYDSQAQRNHGQTLNRLAERGGLSVCELLAVVENREWHKMSNEEASIAIQAWIKSHDAALQNKTENQ